MAQVGLQIVVERLRSGLAEPDSDGALLDRYLATGDSSAFIEIVDRHGPRVFAVCRRILGNHHLAEDAYQATFLVFVRKAHTIKPRSALGGFLYGIARKASLKAATMNRRRKDTPVGNPPETTEILRESNDSDELAILDEEIAKLTDTLRSAVMLCELDGISRADAAKQLGIAEGTLSSRLAAARKQLAERLKKRGVTLSAGLFTALGSYATAVGPPIQEVATMSVTKITDGVLRTMLLAKMKTMAVISVLFAMFIGVGVGVSKSGHEAMAAPVPKVAPVEDGLMWTYHCTKGELTAFTPEGKKMRTLNLKDGYRLRGFTPDGSKLVFIGRNGQLADALDLKPGRSIHLRDINESTEGVDTGIAYNERDQFHWSPDGKKVIRVGATSSRNRGEPSSFTNTLIDLETKKETPIRLTHDHEHVSAWSPDGTWLLTTHYANSIQDVDTTYFQYAHYRFDLKSNTSQPLGEKLQLGPSAISPDGRTMFGTATEAKFTGPKNDHIMVSTDVATGKSTQLAHHEDQKFASPQWSPSGKRVAYSWCKRTNMNEAFLSIIDPDGKNRTTITIPTPGSSANELAFFGWFPAKPNKANQTRKQAITVQVLPKMSEQKKPDEPAWKAEFRKAYGLKDSELVRRIAPPYPECRTEYFREVARSRFKRANQPENPEVVNEDQSPVFTVFNWNNATPSAGWQTRTESADVGVKLAFVLDKVLGFYTTRIEADQETLKQHVTGDFIVRTGADPEKLAVQLEAILQNECEMPLKLSLKETEEVGFVLSGKYAAKPLEDRKANEIELYATHLTDRKTGGGGSGTLKVLTEHLERHIKKTIVLGEIDGEPKMIRWHDNIRFPPKFDTAKDIDTLAEDTDPKAVMDNFAKQTGLMVKTEKRKIQKLVVTKAPTPDKADPFAKP